MNFSVVIPVFNELENLKPLYNELSRSLQGKDFKYEVIFVDDASTDNSYEFLSSLDDKNIRTIRNNRNRGQGRSIANGIQVAKFPLIVTMDADMQNVPSDIERLLNHKIYNNLVLVNGKRDKRNDKILKKTQSFVGNNLFKWTFSHPVSDIGCGLKVFDKEAFENIEFKHNIHRYLSILFHIHSYNTDEVVVQHRFRMAGKTKYGFKRVLHVLRDYCLLISYRKNIRANVNG